MNEVAKSPAKPETKKVEAAEEKVKPVAIKEVDKTPEKPSKTPEPLSAKDTPRTRSNGTSSLLHVVDKPSAAALDIINGKEPSPTPAPRSRRSPFRSHKDSNNGLKPPRPDGPSPPPPEDEESEQQPKKPERSKSGAEVTEPKKPETE